MIRRTVVMLFCQIIGYFSIKARDFFACRLLDRPYISDLRKALCLLIEECGLLIVPGILLAVIGSAILSTLVFVVVSLDLGFCRYLNLIFFGVEYSLAAHHSKVRHISCVAETFHAANPPIKGSVILALGYVGDLEIPNG